MAMARQLRTQELARQQAETPQPADETPDFDVQRKDPGTLEVNRFIPRFVVTGQTVDVTVMGHDFHQTDKVEAGAICHVKQSKINSSHQIKLTLTVDDVTDGKCEITVTGPKRPVRRQIEVQLNPAATERQAAAMQKQLTENKARLQELAGKRWDVKFPSGKSEAWTVDEVSELGLVKMKGPGDKEYNVALAQNDEVTFQGEGACLFTGKLANGKIEGTQPLPGCGMGTGPFSVTINK
jgi:hypothetical protein